MEIYYINEFPIVDLHYPNYLSFMKNNYKPNFSYQEFAHEFTAELFNATKWALLFRDSGAKWVNNLTKKLSIEYENAFEISCGNGIEIVKKKMKNFWR